MEPTTRTYERLIRFVCEQPWAVLPSTLALMRSILRMRAAGFKFTAEEIAERIGTPEARTGPAPREPGQIAVIPVWGLIGHRANELRDISSAVGTSTEILGAQIEAAIADPAVTSIVLDIDSPGGGVFGVEEVATTIRAARAQKPIIAVSNALAASAAYWIASAASEVVVTPSGLVGSIGVYSMHEDHSKELAEAGIDVTLIRAGKFKAEDNPFGPLTDAARAAIQERVDAYYALFTRDVAKGRGARSTPCATGSARGASSARRKRSISAWPIASRRWTTCSRISSPGRCRAPSRKPRVNETPAIAADFEEIPPQIEPNAPIPVESRHARKPPTNARGGCDCGFWNSREQTTPRAAAVTR
jgi:signal peptide peptidase SppA